jgi:hypothetical protein
MYRKSVVYVFLLMNVYNTLVRFKHVYACRLNSVTLTYTSKLGTVQRKLQPDAGICDITY